MSIGKIFSKVFGEQIFDVNLRESFDKHQRELSSSSCTVEALAPIPKCPDVPLTDDNCCRQIAKVKEWLNNKLENIELTCEEAVKQQECVMTSRLGPEKVIFDVDFDTTLRISTDRLTIRSQGSFNTIKANVCVFGGRWMYEFQLQSKGVMQIGWCSSKCTFNDNSGVGDTKHSYGFDGSKQKIWHISTSKYGENWQSGDIIGVCLDVDEETIEYYRNGKSLGEAFTKIEKGPGIAFFPAVSLGYSEGLKGNFGGSPFRFPVEGYSPLQAKPFVKLEKSNLLISYLINLTSIMSKSKCRKEVKTKDSTKRTIYVVFCSIIMEKLTETLLDTYVIEEKLLFYIKNLCALKNEPDKQGAFVPGTNESMLGILLSTLWGYLEVDEMRFVLKKLANILLSSYTQTSSSIDYERQRKIIGILNCLCNHPSTRKFYLEHKFFKKHCLPIFMYLKPPEYSYMKIFIPDENIWTEGIGGPKQPYLSKCESILKSVEPLYLLQKSLIRNLLTNNDGDETHPSSRKIFVNKLRRYVIDSSLEQKPLQSLFFLQSSIHHPIEAPVALSFLCILVDVSATMFEREIPNKKEINPKCFFDGSFEYHHFDRVGGVLSHLRKIHRADIIQQLGAERTAMPSDGDRNMNRAGEMVVEPLSTEPSFFLTGSPNNFSLGGRSQGTQALFLHRPLHRHPSVIDPTPGNMNAEASLFELLDISILWYYSVGHKYVVKISSVRDEIAGLNEILNETRIQGADVEKKIKALEKNGTTMTSTHCDIISELSSKFRQREAVFTKRSMELARKQCWYRSVALGKHRRNLLIWLLDKTLLTLQRSSDIGPLFAFVPEVYINILPILLDTILDFSFHDLVVQFDASDAESVINNAAIFLSDHAADQRIILASCKDSLLQALGTLTCHSVGIKALENAPENSQSALIKALLRPYENRAWGQSNWLLLRFWLGEGFAYRDSRQPSIWQGGNEPLSLGLCRSRAKNETHTGLLHHVAPASPSKHFQQVIGKRLREDEPFATAFMNSVLSQLNWAFSEFILLLQEIQNTAHRQENTLFEPKQLKICSMCFELTVSLMRCLEMIVVIAPDIFHDSSRPNSDLILNRVCQLISQVLSRVTVPPGCFQFIVDTCSSDLSSVTHFAIITAALGILIALMRSEIDSDTKPVKITRITRALLTDPSFQIATLEFALGEVKTPILQQTDIPRGNFDPQTRAHIDPLTNDVRITNPSTSSKRIRADPPIIKFALTDYPSHITRQEVEDVQNLIEMLRVKQTLLSDITLPSEDSLCPICYAKPIAVSFNPCRHQSCVNCILQHLMNSKVCFYCKSPIKDIEDADGKVIYNNADYSTEIVALD